MKNILHRFVFSSLIAVLCILCSGNVQAASLRIEVQGDRVDLQAERVPLIDVVKGVCERTGITLKSSDPMTEVLSRELKGLSVEKSLRRLLTYRNYALIYEGKGDSQSVLVTLRVLGTGAAVTVQPEAAASLPDDPLKRYDKKEFAKMLRNPTNRIKRVSARAARRGPGTEVQRSGDSINPGEQVSPVEVDHRSPEPDGQVLADSHNLSNSVFSGEVDRSPGIELEMSGDSQDLGNPVSASEVNPVPGPDEMEGIRLTHVPSESPLAKIGLEEGDIVRDVNGQLVKSTDELLAALENPPGDQPLLRIERERKTGLIDPIYIELH